MDYPPYGEVRERWVGRCVAEAKRAARAALLMPAATDTRTFQKAFTACTTCLFIQGRIKFGVQPENRRQESASHGSALFGFGGDLEPLADLGVIAIPVVRELVLKYAG